MRNKSQLRKNIQEREAKQREELNNLSKGLTLEERSILETGRTLKKRNSGTYDQSDYAKAKEREFEKYEKSLKTQDQDWKPEHKKG